MGCNIDFKMFQSLQALNKMCNKQVLDSMSKDNENMWFLGLSKFTLMRHMMRDAKVATIPSTAFVSMPTSVPWQTIYLELK